MSAPVVPDRADFTIDHLEAEDCPRSPTVGECIRNTPTHGTTVLACPECGDVVAQAYERPEPGTDAWDVWAEYLNHHADEQAAGVQDRREDHAHDVAALLRRAVRQAQNMDEPKEGDLAERLFLDVLHRYPSDVADEAKDRFDSLLQRAISDADESHAREQRKEGSA